MARLKINLLKMNAMIDALHRRFSLIKTRRFNDYSGIESHNLRKTYATAVEYIRSGIHLYVEQPESLISSGFRT